MKLSTQLYLWVIVEQMRDARKIQLSELYKEETLLVSEDDIYAE